MRRQRSVERVACAFVLFSKSKYMLIIGGNRASIIKD